MYKVLKLPESKLTLIWRRNVGKLLAEVSCITQVCGRNDAWYWAEQTPWTGRALRLCLETCHVQKPGITL